MQEVPKDLICEDQCTIHEHHVPLLIGCETLQMKGEGREDGQHHMMRSTHPYLFQKVDAQKRQTDLCSEGKDKVVHSYMQSTLDIDVSLHGGIPPGRPPDQEMMGDDSHLVAPLIDFGGVKTLGGLDTT